MGFVGAPWRQRTRGHRNQSRVMLFTPPGVPAQAGESSLNDCARVRASVELTPVNHFLNIYIYFRPNFGSSSFG